MACGPRPWALPKRMLTGPKSIKYWRGPKCEILVGPKLHQYFALPCTGKPIDSRIVWQGQPRVRLKGIWGQALDAVVLHRPITTLPLRNGLRPSTSRQTLQVSCVQAQSSHGVRLQDCNSYDTYMTTKQAMSLAMAVTLARVNGLGQSLAS